MKSKKKINHQVRKRKLVKLESMAQKGGSLTTPTEIASQRNQATINNEFQKECEGSMKALILPEEDFNTEILRKREDALDLFLQKNKYNNTDFFLSLGGFTPRGRGRGRGRGRSIDSDFTASIGRGRGRGSVPELGLKNYSDSLQLRLGLYHEPGGLYQTNRRITFLKTHSNYGNTYFKVPDNITFCFLTSLNKYSFSINIGENNFFNRKIPLLLRKKYFEDIYNYNFNYFYETPIDCDFVKGIIGMDYFREATWYFPGQLCPDSSLGISRKEFNEKPKHKNILSVDDVTYELYYDNKILLNEFFEKNNEKFQMNLTQLIMSGQFPRENNYLVILDGCRVYDSDSRNFTQVNQYNFIHYHLTRQLCRIVLEKYKELGDLETSNFKKLEKPLEIPSLHSTTRPRQILFYDITEEGLEAIKKDLNLNYYSANNQIIHHFLEKLKEAGNLNRAFCNKIRFFCRVLNLDKILRLAQKIYVILDGKKRTDLYQYCFDNDLIVFKRNIFTETLDNLLGKQLDSSLNLENFNIDIVLSMVKRFGYLLKLLEFFKITGIQIEPLENLPKIFGVEYLTSNIFYQSNKALRYSNDPNYVNTLIMKCSVSELETIFYHIENTQKNVIFYQINFDNQTVNFSPLRTHKISIIRSVYFKLNTNFNPTCPEIKIDSCFTAVSSLKLDFVQKLTILNTTLNSFNLNCRQLTYLELELNDTADLVSADFYLPHLETLILKASHLLPGIMTNFNIEQAPKLTKVHLENLDFSENTKWTLAKFRLLMVMNIINCRFKGDNFFSTYIKLNKLKLINLSITSIEELLSKKLDKSKKLDELTIYKIRGDVDENKYEELINSLRNSYLNKGYVDPTSFPRISSLLS